MQNAECRMQNAECRMQNAVSRQKQLITVFVIANAQRTREKGLIILFHEVMSHVASGTRRVYRADVMRHKSGRLNKE